MARKSPANNRNTLAFVERPPLPHELEQFRLLLSTYQDGTGQLGSKEGKTLPGWRDFERAVASAFGGHAQESKYIFDVLIPDLKKQGVHYGISCKMRGTLNDTIRTGRVTIELSNSAKKFWNALAVLNLNQENYRLNPRVVGKMLIHTVESWHQAVSLNAGGNVDLSRSFYLTLSWNAQGQYQIHQFPLKLPDHQKITWEFPSASRIVGNDETGKIIEWYGESGAQLKYYPPISKATWISNTFQLESLPEDVQTFNILAKAKAYFPKQWSKISNPD